MDGKTSAHRTWKSLRDSHIPTRPFHFSEFRTQNTSRAAYLCVLRVARFRPRKSAPAFAPLICVYFECNSGLSLSPVPRGPVDTLGLPRSPLRKRADTPHLAGLDATPHPLAGELGEPVRSVPASRRPPLAVLLDAPRRGSHFRQRERMRESLIDDEQRGKHVEAMRSPRVRPTPCRPGTGRSSGPRPSVVRPARASRTESPAPTVPAGRATQAPIASRNRRRDVGL